MDPTTIPNHLLPALAAHAPQTYGFDVFLQQADAVSWTVVILLLVMSILSWEVMLYRGFTLWWLRRRAAKALTRFWAAGTLVAGAQALTEAGPCARLAGKTLAATRHFDRHGAAELARGSSFAELLTRLLGQGLAEERARLEAGLTILASVGSTAPFIGLFGTVWGIHHALVRIGVTGEATLDQVAGPVGEALIMTALGLAVAVPAVLGYNALLRGNGRLLGMLEAFATGLMTYAITGAPIALPQDAAAPEAAPAAAEDVV